METTIDVGASRGGQARPKGKASASQKDLNRVRIVLLLKNIGFAALTYGAMVLYATGYLPLWGLIAANVLFYIRAYLRMHDLCHAFSTNNLLVRFVPTALYANPVWGG